MSADLCLHYTQKLPSRTTKRNLLAHGDFFETKSKKSDYSDYERSIIFSFEALFAPAPPDGVRANERLPS